MHYYYRHYFIIGRWCVCMSYVCSQSSSLPDLNAHQCGWSLDWSGNDCTCLQFSLIQRPFDLCIQRKTCLITAAMTTVGVCCRLPIFLFSIFFFCCSVFSLCDIIIPSSIGIVISLRYRTKPALWFRFCPFHLPIMCYNYNYRRIYYVIMKVDSLVHRSLSLSMDRPLTLCGIMNNKRNRKEAKTKCFVNRIIEWRLPSISYYLVHVAFGRIGHP